MTIQLNFKSHFYHSKNFSETKCNKLQFNTLRGVIHIFYQHLRGLINMVNYREETFARCMSLINILNQFSGCGNPSCRISNWHQRKVGDWHCIKANERTRRKMWKWMGSPVEKCIACIMHTRSQGVSTRYLALATA